MDLPEPNPDAKEKNSNIHLGILGYWLCILCIAKLLSEEFLWGTSRSVSLVNVTRGMGTPFNSKKKKKGILQFIQKQVSQLHNQLHPVKDNKSNATSIKKNEL